MRILFQSEQYGVSIDKLEPFSIRKRPVPRHLTQARRKFPEPVSTKRQIIISSVLHLANSHHNLFLSQRNWPDSSQVPHTRTIQPKQKHHQFLTNIKRPLQNSSLQILRDRVYQTTKPTTVNAFNATPQRTLSSSSRQVAPWKLKKLKTRPGGLTRGEKNISTQY